MADVHERPVGEALGEDMAGAEVREQPEGAATQGQPSEEELRAAYEAELSRITTAEMILQTVVSLLNLGARRLGLDGGPSDDSSVAPAGGRDLDQVRDAIDAVRGLMPVLERRMPKKLGPLRDALAQLQMAFAREANAKPEQKPSGTAKPGPESAEPSAAGASNPGPAESSGRLWVPGR